MHIRREERKKNSWRDEREIQRFIREWVFTEKEKRESQKKKSDQEGKLSLWETKIERAEET